MISHRHMTVIQNLQKKGQALKVVAAAEIDKSKLEAFGKQLGMRPEEIFRLSDFSKEDFLKMMTKGVTGYSKAEFITKI